MSKNRNSIAETNKNEIQKNQEQKTWKNKIITTALLGSLVTGNVACSHDDEITPPPKKDTIEQLIFPTNKNIIHNGNTLQTLPLTSKEEIKNYCYAIKIKDPDAKHNEAQVLTVEITNNPEIAKITYATIDGSKDENDATRKKTKTLNYTVQRQDIIADFPSELPQKTIIAGDKNFFSELQKIKIKLNTQEELNPQILVNDQKIDAEKIHCINIPNKKGEQYKITLQVLTKNHQGKEVTLSKDFFLTVAPITTPENKLTGYQQMELPHFLDNDNFLSYKESVKRAGYWASLAFLQDKIFTTKIENPAIVPEINEGGTHVFEKVREVFGNNANIKTDETLGEVNDNCYARIENYAKNNPDRMIFLEYNGAWSGPHSWVWRDIGSEFKRRELLDKYPNIYAARPVGRDFDEANQASREKKALLFGLSDRREEKNKRTSDKWWNGNKYESSKRDVNPWLKNNDLPNGKKQKIFWTIARSDSEGAVMMAMELAHIVAIQDMLGRHFSSREELIKHLKEELDDKYFEKAYLRYRDGEKMHITDEVVQYQLDRQDYLYYQAFNFNTNLEKKLLAGEKSKLFEKDFDNAIIHLEKELWIVKEEWEDGKINYFVDPLLLKQQGNIPANPTVEDYRKIIDQLKVFVAAKVGDKKRSYYIPDKYRK